MSPGFMEKVERLRAIYGKPMHVSSAYRCLPHNKAVGGGEKSMHLVGRAIDFKVASDAERFEILRIAVGLFGGVGIMKNAIHVDDRQTGNRAWTYYP